MRKLNTLFFALILVICIFTAAGCSSTNSSQKEKVELTISAAASLNDALAELKAIFEKQNPNITITYNIGASGTLQQQISQGAPVDLFFSAAADKFDQLVREGFIEKHRNLIGNDLVLITPKSSHLQIRGFEDLANRQVKQISIGIPESVPAGAYAKETLEHFGLWGHAKDKLVLAKDVRQVLSYVETGNVEAGIVYKTDALLSSKIHIAATADEQAHTPIVYPLGIIKDTPYPKEAELFFQFMLEDRSIEILKKYGFKPLN